ncbi:HAMP domain-containing histidine kinase [Marinobacter sp. M3C]|jgi:signal transduction histidine kinase|uniref:sensor histidine kinase n=1 Tax=Marinobacter sp. M3C TaxID=2917715 RepID=UPI0020103FB2|nr:HAMP domain-containing sensor histidine kinase [Marinobacter sp. M3C]MCL1476338.1 HAMP domain-containing histidine kinase [Marinobacter sp.]MCL1479967.1 HAMP domain-containing histidine kinase [Marinobacter sp.]UQG60681.1 HAMP domain-containing histidine kinase [Marinobacter sp. M3C]
MKSSLTARLVRTLFFLIAATTATSMFIVEVFVNDVEDTILRLELKAEAEYFTEQLQQGRFQNLKTAQLEAVFLPEGEADAVMPEYFQSLSLPFSREIEVGQTTLLIYGEQLEAPDGKLFLAKDITIMESRENLVLLVLMGVAGLMLLIGFFVARTGAQYLIRPFRKLTHQVLNTVPGSLMEQIATDYRDQEFCDIAEAFNRFLFALEHHIEREKSFVKLASHELRTPLAVMSGALNVLEQRQSLSAADQKTLARIRRAMQTMRDDTEVLLELARSEAPEGNARTIVLQEIVQNTIDDLEHGNSAYSGRITVCNDSHRTRIKTQPALVRMLLRNLLQNALRHTHAGVEVRMIKNKISVRDFGPGLPSKITEHLSAIGAPRAIISTAGEFSNTTFGLLIVRLVCERLGWNLEIAQSDNKGTEFLIHFQNSA